MSAPDPAAPGALAALPPGRYGPAGVVRAEFTKLRTVRSTIWSLAATVVLTVGIGVLATAVIAARWDHLGTVRRLTFDPVSQSLTGLLFAQLALGVLGILVVSGEYGTGSIRSTLAAVPNRPLVLAAKALVFAVVALVVSEAVSFAAFLIGQAILAGTTPTASLSQPDALRAVVGGGLYLTVLGLFALGLAAILRHTAGAISTFVGVLLILPLILQALPTSVIDAVGKYLPANIGVTMTTVATSQQTAIRREIPAVQTHSFGPWVGLAVLCGYAAAALLVGGWMMVRRDA